MIELIDWQAVTLSLKLAATTMLCLLLIATPLAWWLSQTRHPMKRVILTLTTLPIVLPPTVLGFYLLLLLGPHGALGQLAASMGIGPLVFSFSGLVIGSIFYSLPFAVQPLLNAFQQINQKWLESAAMMGASPIDRFFTVVLPLSKPGLMSAAILSFAHTLGEFGVILMIGGNIPGETRVMSIAIYDHVDALEFTEAHALAGLMLVFAFIVLFSLNKFNRTGMVR
ncbi:MAG: molybdate ABC transporter permease subunit [Oleiphilus sp.]|nr:MAG: molybdate ABC transporter permease subunit [Oleiphilus sp.]